MLIPAAQAHDTLLSDMRQAPATSNEFHLWWLGQSGFMVHWDGRYLLIDPYLSDSLTKKYAQTDKPHVRMTELCLNPARLDFIDLATSSHNHTDHLDAETLVPLFESNAALSMLVPAANQEFAADRLECEPERLRTIDEGGSIDLAGFTIHAVAAAHETIERDKMGRCLFLGYVFEFGDWAIYHSGDTVRYPGLLERLNAWSINLALLPINGRGEERRVAGNLWGPEAAELAHEAGVQVVIPCHYDMFTFNTDSPKAFITRCKQLGQPFRVLKCGERYEHRKEI